MKYYLSFFLAAALFVLTLGCAGRTDTPSVSDTAATTVTASSENAVTTTPTEGVSVPTEVPTISTGTATVQPSDTPATVEPSVTATWTTLDCFPTTTAKSSTTKKTTAKVTTADWVKYYTSKQILKDNNFQNGFDVVHQTDGVVGTWRNTASTKQPSWQVAQWGTYKSYADRSGYLCMFKDRLPTADNILSNGLNTLTYNAADKSLAFTINTYDYYGETGHIHNDLWPHLLIQQGITDNREYFNMDEKDMPYYSPSADKIVIAFDVRMSEFEHKPLPGVNACQFLSFYYIRSLRDSGFIWFGVPLFDDRGYDPNDTVVHFNIDTGSGNYICNVPVVEVYNSTREDGRYDFFAYEDINKPEASDEWMHVEIDIKPYLNIVFENAKKDSKYNVFSQTTSMDQLYFAGMNMGYEVHGAYDVTFEVKNYTITSYVKK